MRRLLIVALLGAAVFVGHVIGSTTAHSSYVDHSATGAIAFVTPVSGQPPRALDENGVVWYVDEDHGWYLDDTIPPLPVPVSEIKFWAWNALITYDNHIWRIGGSVWVDGGAWPGGASPVVSTTWGRIKAKFSE